MKLIRFYSVIISCFISISQLNAQRILTVDLTEINVTIKNPESPFYYENLLKRFQNFDSTLTKQDFHYLYYGNFFQPTYFPYSNNESQKQFYQLLKSKEFNEALIHGKLANSQEPLNLKVLFGLYICYSKLGQPKIGDQYLFQYYGLLSAIFNSGDGKSISTAFVVLSVDDEYEFIASIHHRVKKQELILGSTDLMYLEKTKSKPKKTPNYRKMYFNVEIPFLYMRNNK
jgi:hypothetical protein